jgi:hypothetical protein
MADKKFASTEESCGPSSKQTMDIVGRRLGVHDRAAVAWQDPTGPVASDPGWFHFHVSGLASVHPRQPRQLDDGRHPPADR